MSGGIRRGLTDAQWEIVEPMLPLIKEPGRIPKRPRRTIVDAILYVVRSGCSWRQLPVDFPPWQTVYWQFQQWEKRQVTERILAELGRRHRRTRLLRIRRREEDNGRKRFIVTDTPGMLVVVCVISASWQNRDGATTTLLNTYLTSPIRHVFADQGFAGKLVDWAAERLATTIEIVRKPAEQRGFVVNPKRWVVERMPGLADRAPPSGPRLRT